MSLTESGTSNSQRQPHRLHGRHLLFLVALIGALAALAIWWLSTRPRPPDGPLDTLILATEAGLHASPVWVAERNGYFIEEGVRVEIREFESGRTALFTMLDKGGIDIATAAQTPVVARSFDRRDYAIIANMVSSDDDIKMLARRDRGIQAPADLRGKTIGITSGSSGHFFLGLFLAYHHLLLSDVTIRDLEPARLGDALVQGEVDAIATWEPHIYRTRQALAGNAMLLPNEGIYREDFYLVARADVIRDHPEALKRFLKAIERAERFIAERPSEARAVVQRRLNVDREVLEATWKDFRFALSLDQSVLLALEDEAHWAMDNHLTASVQVPNYLEYLHTDTLLAVTPEAVTVAGRGR